MPSARSREVTATAVSPEGLAGDTKLLSPFLVKVRSW